MPQLFLQKRQMMSNMPENSASDPEQILIPLVRAAILSAFGKPLGADAENGGNCTLTIFLLSKNQSLRYAL